MERCTKESCKMENLEKGHTMVCTKALRCGQKHWQIKLTFWTANETSIGKNAVMLCCCGCILMLRLVTKGSGMGPMHVSNKFSTFLFMCRSYIAPYLFALVCSSVVRIINFSSNARAHAFKAIITRNIFGAHLHKMWLNPLKYRITFIAFLHNWWAKCN